MRTRVWCSRYARAALALAPVSRRSTTLRSPPRTPVRSRRALTLACFPRAVPAPAPVASLDPRRRRPRVFVARFDRSLQTCVVTCSAREKGHERGDTSNGTSPRVHSTEAGRSFGRTAPTSPGQSFGAYLPAILNLLATDRRRLPLPPCQLPLLRGQRQREAETDVPATTRAQACVSPRRFGCWASRQLPPGTKLHLPHQDRRAIPFHLPYRGRRAPPLLTPTPTKVRKSGAVGKAVLVSMVLAAGPIRVA